ncbi:MAG TPA: hypothetical protein EYH06_12905 [Chromatiales bacterium]|nr:hypothetical protein [Chromatiales bacterium]
MSLSSCIENKDIGFIYPGQIAEVKVDAFPFTKYGIIDAEVLTVSNDAVENEKLGWVFTARVKLNKNNIRVENKPIRLTPGMSVSAEIKTGQRKLIEYFLAPLLCYRQESVRER